MHVPVRTVLLAFALGACAPQGSSPSIWRAVLMSDTHVVGPGYTCCENDALDTTSIYYTRERLRHAVGEINALQPMPELVLVAGDIMHNPYTLGSTDVSAYQHTPNTALEAADIFRTFKPDVALAWGNHDYDIKAVPQAFSHQLFDTMFETQPYFAIDKGNFRFLILNSMLGSTWDVDDPEHFNPSVGSFGATQLDWAARQLEDGKPTFLIFHYHPLAGTLSTHERDAEIGSIFDLIRIYADHIPAVFMGHLHRWLDAPTVAAVGLAGIDVGEVPMYILAGLRYDAQNYWVMELDDDTLEWRIVDKDKAQWGTTWSWDEHWDAQGEATIDRQAHPAAFDPATGRIDLEDPVDPEHPPTVE